MKITASYLCVPKVGETANGDAVVIRDEAPVTLIAVVDALGHGPGAATAADAAVKELSEVPLNIGVLAILERVHDKLHGTRGAAAMVCLFDGKKLTGCSVG